MIPAAKVGQLQQRPSLLPFPFVLDTAGLSLLAAIYRAALGHFVLPIFGPGTWYLASSLDLKSPAATTENPDLETTDDANLFWYQASSPWVWWPDADRRADLRHDHLTCTNTTHLSRPWEKVGVFIGVGIASGDDRHRVCSHELHAPIGAGSSAGSATC